MDQPDHDDALRAAALDRLAESHIVFPPEIANALPDSLTPELGFMQPGHRPDTVRTDPLI